MRLRLGCAILAGALILSGCGMARKAVDAGGDAVRAGAGAVRSAAELALAFAPGGRSGGLCGDDRLVGEPAGRVVGRIPQCGIENSVRITQVAGVPLSQPAQVDCPTARSFAEWVERAAIPAYRAEGGLSEIRVAAHYVCRTRNHQPGAKISEHGKGRAIDVSGLTTGEGRVVTLLEGWNDPADGPALRKLHRKACGPFGTVLGPESDRWHKDHFHFDTARHRGGPYCR